MSLAQHGNEVRLSTDDDANPNGGNERTLESDRAHLAWPCELAESTRSVHGEPFGFRCRSAFGHVAKWLVPSPFTGMRFFAFVTIQKI